MRLPPAAQMTALAALLATLRADPAGAQSTNDVLSLPGLMQGAQQWAQDNLDTNVAATLAQMDTNVVAALSQIDTDAVRRFYGELQQRYQGYYVADVAALGQTARTILPILRSTEATRPYAAWLQAQMAYLDVAEEIRNARPPVSPAPHPPAPVTVNPAPVTVRPSPVSVYPSPQQERQLWTSHETGSPWPPAARACVSELKPVFAASHVPTQLVWVAEVESAFDRSAESPEGAAGLFQLMPDTARRFGLSLWPRDQRYQVVPSATASAEYFKYLYGRFQDWRLVMAAYNAGEGTVQKLLNRHNARSYDGIAMYLPAETQMYVPRVEAVIWERERARLEDLPPPQT